MIGQPAVRTVAALALVAAVRVTWAAVAYFEGGRLGRHRLEAASFAFVAVCLLWSALSGAFSRKWPSIAASTTAVPMRVLAAVFAALSLALYWPALRVGLLSDDFSLMARETASILGTGGWDHYRPLPLIAWKVLFPIGGAAALHLLNVLLHGLNAWLVAGLALRLGHRPSLAALAGLMFVTFPAAVEPVVWSSGIFDVAMTTFGLLYLQASLAERRVAMQMLSLAGALLSKETAVALPLAAAALRLGTGRPVRPLLPSAVLTIAYVAARVSVGLAMPAASSASLRYTIKEVIGRPFASLSVPYTGAELASHPFMLGALGVIVLAALVWLSCASAPVGSRGLALASVVVIGVLPLWRFVAIGEDLEGSRYLYLPLVGWSVLLAAFAAHDRAWRRRACAGALLAVFVLPGTWYVRRHLEPWQEAARLRDLVLRSAADVLDRSQCPAARFRDVPDSRQGVYIFRNGFSEALGGRAVSDGGSAPPSCDFTWRIDRFARSD